MPRRRKKRTFSNGGSTRPANNRRNVMSRGGRTRPVPARMASGGVAVTRKFKHGGTHNGNGNVMHGRGNGSNVMADQCQQFPNLPECLGHQGRVKDVSNIQMKRGGTTRRGKKFQAGGSTGCGPGMMSSGGTCVPMGNGANPGGYRRGGKMQEGGSLSRQVPAGGLYGKNCRNQQGKLDCIHSAGCSWNEHNQVCVG